MWHAPKSGLNDNDYDFTDDLISFSEKPDAPKELDIASFDQFSTTLQWKKPDSDGGNPIKGYQVRYSVKGRYCCTYHLIRPENPYEYFVYFVRRKKAELFEQSPCDHFTQVPFTFDN